MGRRYLTCLFRRWMIAAALGFGLWSPSALAAGPWTQEPAPAVPALPDEGPAPTPAVEVPALGEAKPEPAGKPKRPKIAEKFVGGFKPIKDKSVQKASAKPEEEAAPPKSLDPEVVKSQNPAEPADTGPVPVATEGQGGPPTQGIPGDPKSFVLPADRVPLGRQSMGLTVDVVGPEFWNINQVCVLKIVVKNTGAADAMGVSVRDELPDGLAFVSSQPEAQPLGTLLTWSLGIVPANSERTISLSVRPTKIGAFDHAATVTMLAGGKSRTIVREPKLKVEQTATSGKILKGQPAQFKIVISNPGDGPARNVFVRAKLTPGLKHESAAPDQILEQKIDVISAGQRVVLNTLEADTLVGGEQACEVSAESQDVVAGAPDARNRTTVTVVEPKLVMKLLGPDKRFTDMMATYDISMENPGTSSAKNVVVQALLPVGGRLYATPTGATFIQQGRKLVWKKSQLDPGEKAMMTFKVQMGGIGLYQVAAEAKADGGLLAKDTISTDVSGLADVDIDITESRRAVDVGEMTVYKIKIVNRGTKEATKILVSAKIPDTVEPRETSGTDVEGEFQPTTRMFIFPQIDRLGPGKQIELGIKVEAVKPGEAICRVYLTHEEMTEKLEDLAVFKVEKVRR